MPRLLIIKTSSLGDVIHNLPILADISAHHPHMQFDWVVEEAFADIPALHPAVSRVIPVAIRRWRRSLLRPATWREMQAFRQHLRARHYDLVLDSQGLIKSALIALNARGIRHGQDAASAREPLAAVCYQKRHAVAKHQHAVARNRQLAALALGYPPPSGAPDYGISAPFAPPPWMLPPAYLVGIHATSRASKLWPVSHWIALGRLLAARGQVLLLPWGSERERERAQSIANAVPTVRVLPRLRLAELAAVLARARAAVGVDTGLIHLAAALALPTVAIYTDTDHTLTGLYPGCSPAVNLGGIGEIPSPQAVFAAVDEISQAH